MINRVKLTLIFNMVVLTIYGQQASKPLQKSEIRGVTIDQESKAPLPYVTVAVKDKKTGAIISGQISDDKGRFTVSGLPAGVLTVEFQFIGYETWVQQISLADKEKKDLGTIFLREDAALVEGVEITAERSTIEQKADRKVINVGKDLSTLGVTAADVMANIPSISVESDGRISMRGNSNVRVLVNGKPTNLSPEQLLRQIPSASIKSVELITNPSAKFIPDGMSGIINLVLHKNTNRGFNGNISTGYTFGQRFRFTGSTDLNYRTDKWNFYANYGHTRGATPIRGSISRPNDPSNEIWTTDDAPNSHLIKAGLDYELSDRTTMSVFGIYNRFDNNTLRFTGISYPGNENSNLSQSYQSAVRNSNSTFNFDLKHDFVGEGHSLEFEVDYSEFRSTDLATFVFGGEAAVNQSGATEDIGINRKNTTINLDYSSKLAGRQKLEMGLEARIQQTGNSYLTSLPGFNNSNYDFDRDIYALYASYSNVIGKWSYQIGVRVENFDMIGNLQEAGMTDQKFNNPIFSVYPSAFLSYTPDPDEQKDVFNLSLSRRVDRPNLEQMTPIRVWSSPRITNIGNPALVPQFTNSLEFNYTRQLKLGSITTGVFLRKIHNEITRFAFIAPSDDENIFFSYSNYQDNTAYGFELSGNYNPASFWSFTTSFDIYSQQQRGLIQAELQEVQNTLYNLRMNHSFKASEKLTLQLVGLYRGANTNLQYKRLSFSYVNLGARYSLFNDNGTLSMSFNDIFKTQQNSFEADRPVVQLGVFEWDSRTFMISYAHRLGRGKKQAAKRKQRDKNEVKSGGF